MFNRNPEVSGRYDLRKERKVKYFALFAVFILEIILSDSSDSEQVKQRLGVLTIHFPAFRFSR